MVDVINRFGDRAKPQKPSCPEEVIYNVALPGWTGYSWNTELFPDHKELLSWLHENGFKVPLNIHPSQGVRFFEDQYEDMCQRLGKDSKKKELIPFDVTDKELITAFVTEKGIVRAPFDEGFKKLFGKERRYPDDFTAAANNPIKK